MPVVQFSPIPPRTAQLHNCTTANSSYVKGGGEVFLLHNYIFAFTEPQLCRSAEVQHLGVWG